MDVSGPPDIAGALSQSWPDAELVVVDDAAHGADGRAAELVSATDRFAVAR